MKRKNILKSIILSLSLLLIGGLNYGCYDDNDFYTNGIGSSLEIKGKYKISKFILDKGHWSIPDSVRIINIKLQSLNDSSETSYETKIDRSTKLLQYQILIPKGKKIDDSEYIMRGYNKNGISLGNIFKVSFRNEMMTNISLYGIEYSLKGKGTEEDPYLIEDQSDYDTFSNNLLEDPTFGEGIYFSQTASLLEINRTASSKTASLKFSGNYDANQNEVKLNLSGNDNPQGFFPYLKDGAFIKNIKINGSLNNVGKNSGMLCGIAEGHVTLENIRVIGNVNTIDYDNNNRNNVGIIIGSALKCTLKVKNCGLSGEVTGNDNVGGVVGYLSEGSLAIEKVYNTTSYTDKVFSANGRNCIGFIAGFINDSYIKFHDIRFVHSTTQGTGINLIKASGNGTGGLIGKAILNKDSYIDSCYINNSITGYSELGGMIGETQLKKASLTLKDCYMDKIKVIANDSLQQNKFHVGGLIGKASINGEYDIIFKGSSGIAAGIVKAEKYVGGIFGLLDGNVTCIDTVTVNADVTATSYGAGGICGELNNGLITVTDTTFSISPDVSVLAPNGAGGVAGSANNATIIGELPNSLDFPQIHKADFYKSTFGGIVAPYPNNGTGKSLGGIVGYSKKCFFKNVCFSGSITGNDEIGGIAGYAGYGSFFNCVNRANQFKSSGEKVGGIAGRITGYEEIPHVHPLTNITLSHLLNFTNLEQGAEHVGGIVGHFSSYLVASSPNDIMLEYMVNLGNILGKNNAGGCIGYFWDNDRTNVDAQDSPENYTSMCFQNSANFGNVTTQSTGFVGGILGGNTMLTTARFYRCANHGDIKGNNNGDKDETWVGGIVSYLGEESATMGTSHVANGEVAECCNFGNISAGYKDSRVGGIVGEKEEGDSDNPDPWWIIRDSYNTGEINCDNSDVGGIGGYVDRNNKIRYCYNTGKVRDGKGKGIYGDSKGVFDHAKIENCYVLKGSAQAGDAKELDYDDFENENKFVDFDFTDVWKIDDENNKRPYLRHCPFQFTKVP